MWSAFYKGLIPCRIFVTTCVFCPWGYCFCLLAKQSARRITSLKIRKPTSKKLSTIFLKNLSCWHILVSLARVHWHFHVVWENQRDKNENSVQIDFINLDQILKSLITWVHSQCIRGKNRSVIQPPVDKNHNYTETQHEVHDMSSKKMGSKDKLPILASGSGLYHTDNIEVICAISHLWSWLWEFGGANGYKGHLDD
jgi:hypothetical protein